MLHLKKDFLLSLSENCPLVTYREDCPFLKHSQKDFQQKKNWLQNIDALECDELISLHKLCLADRLKKESIYEEILFES